jgi:hypothetical protein
MNENALRLVAVGIVAIGLATTAIVFAITVASRVSGAVPTCQVPKRRAGVTRSWKPESPGGPAQGWRGDEFRLLAPSHRNPEIVL